jgi:hypothetical protein
MALLIDKNVTILGDVNISQLYVRLTAYYGPGGSPIFVKSSCYSSKESYDLNPSRNSFYVEGVPMEKEVSYDRSIDGNDLLTHIHNDFKTYLSTDEMTESYVLDPSTGQPTLDPSTGDPIIEMIVSVPKFAQDSSISVIDVE